MPTALILIADGSEEIEFVTPYDVLTRAGFAVKSVGVKLKQYWANCSRNVKIVPDYPNLAAAGAEETADVLIIPGGAPGAKAMSSDDQTLALIRKFRTEGKWVACICAGTTALVASVREGGDKATVTSHPSVAEEIKAQGWPYSEERVVVDGKVITSRGPGTAMLFALTIVEQLTGKEKREEITGPMICAATL